MGQDEMARAPDGVAEGSVPEDAAGEGPPAERGAKILAIDDEPDVLDFLRLVLERSGYQVVTARNGTDGLIKAHVERPDLILLDIMMEEMDGWETLRLLQLDEASQSIPVVILSARAEPRDKVRGIQEGAVDYITKPFSLRDSLERIEAILGDRAASEAGEGGPPR